MMLEVELKAALTGVPTEALRRAAGRTGFVLRRELRETDVYFCANNRDFRKTDEALRLRACQNLLDGAAEAFITYKGPKLDALSSARAEYETAVGDLDVMQKLLEALGYQVLFTVDKTRREFELDGVTLCLDTVAGLGDFLELELLAESDAAREAAVDRLFQLLDRLGVPRGNLTRKSYLELLIAD